MITLISCLILIGFLLVCYVVRELFKQESRDRAATRLFVAIGNRDREVPYSDKEAKEWHQRRWEGD
jgi:hypothetical protein